ncbi:ComEC/Rec2 family competence protein [Haloactinospora alba]|uniref:ComEC/Rec2 family competence protein n=1 Tax=Haloactinospora alba TaxID=405555 RepID=UPI001FE5FE85|nr:ComEC/Rec2 family competence protein [Haloactinospora alba]
MPSDLRLVLPSVGTWLCSAFVLGAGTRTAVATAVSLLALSLAVPLLAWGLRRRHHGTRWVLPALAVTVCAAAGALATGGRLAGVDSSPVPELAEQEADVGLRVEVTRDPRPRAEPNIPGRDEYVVQARTEWVEVDGERVRSRVPVVLLAPGEDWSELLPGHPVRLRGTIVPAEEGLVAGLVLVRGPPAGVGEPNWPQTWAGEVRSRLREAAATLPEPADGLLPAVVVGDVAELGEGTEANFRATGMTHLLTVSGANLAVLTGAVLALGRWFRWPPWLVAGAGSGMIAVFVLVARAEPSVLRSAVMGGIALLALALGRQRAGIASLAAAVLGLVLFDPALSRSYGFALSVLATGGIMVLAPRWRDRWSARIPRWLAEAVAVALAAHVACAPVLVLLSAEFSWVAVPANVLTGPFMPVATVGGFVVAGVALLWPAAAAFVAWVPGSVVLWTGVVAAVGARVPRGALPWRDDPLGALGLGTVLLVLLYAGGRFRRVLAALLAAVGVTAVVTVWIVPPWPPAGWAVVACDVGQGDALVLHVAEDRAVVVDTGPAPLAVDRCLTDLGVRDVPLLVLSHGDADHTGGITGVLSGRRVGSVLAPRLPSGSEAVRTLDGAGVSWRTAASGQRWRVGPWELEVLWPPPGTDGQDNEASVVLLARGEHGPDAGPVSVLLTGDIEREQQRVLLGTREIREVDVLKTPHHGAGGQEPKFLAAARPRVTLTSAGKDNPYGHPAPATWRLLGALTKANYRTDEHGDIAVVPQADGMAVTWRGRQR